MLDTIAKLTGKNVETGNGTLAGLVDSGARLIEGAAALFENYMDSMAARPLKIDGEVAIERYSSGDYSIDADVANSGQDYLLQVFDYILNTRNGSASSDPSHHIRTGDIEVTGSEEGKESLEKAINTLLQDLNEVDGLRTKGGINPEDLGGNWVSKDKVYKGAGAVVGGVGGTLFLWGGLLIKGAPILGIGGGLAGVAAGVLTGRTAGEMLSQQRMSQYAHKNMGLQVNKREYQNIAGELISNLQD